MSRIACPRPPDLKRAIDSVNEEKMPERTSPGVSKQLFAILLFSAGDVLPGVERPNVDLP
jgi:hypothetical protein